MTRSELPLEVQAALARRARFWMRVAMFLAGVTFYSQVTALVIHWTTPPPPTLHTRRIAVGGWRVTLEIPDGQCASALGVTVCVPARAH